MKSKFALKLSSFKFNKAVQNSQPNKKNIH